MQKSANKVSEQIIAENKRDMSTRRNKLKTVNKLRGRSENEIDTQSDGFYLNNYYTGVGETPYAPSTQTVYTTAENQTEERQIIDVRTKSKLCSLGKFHVSEAEVMACRCTANIPIQQNIGDEYKWAKESLRDLKQSDNLEVRHITTDPDTASFRAAVDLKRAGITETAPENLIDTRHLTQNHRKFIKKSSVLMSLMPGRTKADKERLRNRFAVDLSKRCQAEFNSAFKKHKGDPAKVIRSTAFAVNAIVRCYQGDHSICTEKSSVCTSKKGNWIERSSFLPGGFKIKSTSMTGSVIRMCVNYRLSKTTVLKTKLNSNTQKVESVNRRIRRSLPNTVTYQRNFHGRAHSAIHASNNGPGESLIKLCEAVGCPIVTGSSVAHQLQKEQDFYNMQKKNTRQ